MPPPTPPPLQSFLHLCQNNHFQFDTLRRAKHSSMMVLYHIHNPHVSAFASSCNSCHIEIQPGTGWHCNQCPDFDICTNCKNTKGHPHPLVVRVLCLRCEALLILHIEL